MSDGLSCSELSSGSVEPISSSVDSVAVGISLLEDVFGTTAVGVETQADSNKVNISIRSAIDLCRFFIRNAP
jgi:hypothetical protein